MNTNTKKQLDELIARAKENAKVDKRHSNKGRPYSGMDSEQAQRVGYMRKRGVSLRSIHTMFKEKNLTSYDKYGTFKAAWTQHKVES